MEWATICVFEKQFSATNKTDISSSIEKITEAKWQYFEACKAAENVGKYILKCLQTTMHRRVVRKARGAEIHDMVHINASQKHLPGRIESDIILQLETLHPNSVKKAICVEYEDSRQSNSIHVYLSCTDTPNQEKQICIAQSVHQSCSKKHGIAKTEVMFYARDAFDKFKTCIDRFELRDSIVQGEYEAMEIAHHILMSPPSEDDIPEEEDRYLCATCFTADLTVPLHVKTFDLSSEWLFDVPAPVQFLLYPFINRRSF
jgi:hypothetical protein